MKKTFTVLILFFFLSSFRLNAQISTFPYVATGDNPVGWNVIQGPFLWYLSTATNPAGVANDAALVCNFYGNNPGVEGIVISPAFNFTSLARPVLHFYVSYRSFNSEDDSLQILISTNGGFNFINTPTPYSKGYSSAPSLATLASSHTEYIPSSTSQWRHETIDLTAYAGQNNIMIGLRGVSAFGNNLWIDNFIVTEADNYCQIPVTSTGTYGCSDGSVVMNTIGLSPTGHQYDNPGGGVLSFTQHIGEDPVPSLANPPIAPNNTATTQDGSIFTPNIIAPDSWFTISYTGNDWTGNANYDVRIDITNFISVLDPTKLYIVKRADLTGGWISLNTTFSGSMLISSGLTNFSDFAVGGDSISNPLPVELVSFASFIDKNDVTLNWKTATENNNARFEIERMRVNGQLPVSNVEWSTIGNIQGNGTSNAVHNYSFTDRGLSSGKYNYRLKQIDYNGNFVYYNLSNEIVIGIPNNYSLSQNYPNPFNPTTKIDFELPFDGMVSMKLYDMSGKEVATLINEVKASGYYTITFNAADISSGVYFYRIQAESNGSIFNATKKMIVTK